MSICLRSKPSISLARGPWLSHWAGILPQRIAQKSSLYQKDAVQNKVMGLGTLDGPRGHDGSEIRGIRLPLPRGKRGCELDPAGADPLRCTHGWRPTQDGRPSSNRRGRPSCDGRHPRVHRVRARTAGIRPRAARHRTEAKVRGRVGDQGEAGEKSNGVMVCA